MQGGAGIMGGMAGMGDIMVGTGDMVGIVAGITEAFGDTDRALFGVAAQWSRSMTATRSGAGISTGSVSAGVA